MNLKIKRCEKDNLNVLIEISKETFISTFEDSNTEENLKEYIESAFNTNKMYEELLNENSVFYILYDDKIPVGYLKLNEGEGQSDIKDYNSLEIERIYVVKEFQGMGIGKILLDKAIEFALDRKKDYIWLGVWEKNEKALAFYKKNNFIKISQHSFFMGDDEQLDYIMKKDLKSYY
jgi:ribosomal protein S18 acetylase RimI-like enzyme